MPERNLLNTSSVSYSDIIGNQRIYQVPTYQRDYSWEEENWEDLWTDILQMVPTKQPHYMGAIVLKHLGGKQYLIIDGQQRLATLSILVIAVIKLIKELVEKGNEKEQNKERIELLRKKFLGEKDASSLHYSSKLFLNENNDPFYQSYLLQFRTPSTVKRLSDSNQLLWDAYNYFLKKISKHFSEKLTGENLAAFIERYVADYLIFIQIIVENELNAYTIFETLNSRGIELTPTDLLKNYLFSLVAVSDTDLKHVKVQWKEIIDSIGLSQFPDFLRHFLNSRYPFIRKEHLFKYIRNSIERPEHVFNILDALEDAAAIYKALDNPGDELWDKDRRKNIRDLKLFQAVGAKPMLLSAYLKYNRTEFSRLLRLCVIMSFRYSIIGKKNPNELESVYNKIAVEIYNKNITTAREAFRLMQYLYPPDEDFKNDFATKAINTKNAKKLVRYILYALENQLAASDRDYEADDGTIEHILPESPDIEWNNYFSEDIQHNYIYRLGNYTLLEAKKNAQVCGSQPFEKKKDVYHSSQYKMTLSIKASEWNPVVLKQRQEKLAKIAASVWKVDY